MKYTLTTLLMVCIITISCDSESITNSFIAANPPTAKISILNQEELAEKSVGDSVLLEILLEVEDMIDIKDIIFSIGFDGEYFAASNLKNPNFPVGEVDPSSYHFEDTPNFFLLSGESYTDALNGIYDEGEEFTDLDGNGVYDEGEEFIDALNFEYDEGESYDDENENNQYDYPDLSPEGIIMATSNSFEGNLGIPNPEQNGNKSGDGDICILYLSGIYVESLITLDIIDASQYDESTSAYVEASPSPDSWDITSTIEVGSQYNPIMLLNQLDDDTEGIITIELSIEDSPQIVDFSSLIIYDPNILNVIEYEFLNFFNASNYYYSFENNIQEGRIYISSSHEVVTDLSIDISEHPISQGSGEIIKVRFAITDESLESIADGSLESVSLSMPKDNIAAKGYSSSDNIIYDYDIYFSDVQESIDIIF